MASISDELSLLTYGSSRHELPSTKPTTFQDEDSRAEMEKLRVQIESLQSELEQERKQAKHHKDSFAGSGLGGDKVAKKIVDLSKHNRELGAELIRLRQTIRDLQSKLKAYEEKKLQESVLPQDDTKTITSTASGKEEREFKAARSVDMSSLKAKLSTARNQVDVLKQELAVAHKMLSKEVGEGFTVSELLGGESGWRGRAQQITALQNKVSYLKKQLRSVEGRDPDASSSNQAGKERIRIKELEQKRRAELEEKSGELDALKEAHSELVKQVSALRARNRTLSSQVKSAGKPPPHTTTLSAHPPSRQQGPNSASSCPPGSRSGEGRRCMVCDSTRATAQVEVLRKEREITALKEELKVYKSRRVPPLEESRIHSAPGLGTNHIIPNPAHGRLQPSSKLDAQDSLDLSQWSTRARVAEVEKDRLMEMIALLQQRLDESVSRLSELSHHKPRKHVGGTSTSMSGGDSDLTERLQLQMDENQALKDTLSHYQSSKAQDIRVLTELFKQSRIEFSQTIKDLKSMLKV